MLTQTRSANVIRYFGDNDDIYDQLQRVIPEVMEYDEPMTNYNEVLIYTHEIETDAGTRLAYKTVVFLQDAEPVGTAVCTSEIK